MFGTTFVDQQQQETLAVMGCYGLGVSRILATVVEVRQLATWKFCGGGRWAVLVLAPDVLVGTVARASFPTPTLPLARRATRWTHGSAHACHWMLVWCLVSNVMADFNSGPQRPRRGRVADLHRAVQGGILGLGCRFGTVSGLFCSPMPPSARGVVCSRSPEKGGRLFGHADWHESDAIPRLLFFPVRVFRPSWS